MESLFLFTAPLLDFLWMSSGKVILSFGIVLLADRLYFRGTAQSRHLMWFIVLFAPFFPFGLILPLIGQVFSLSSGGFLSVLNGIPGLDPDIVTGTGVSYGGAPVGSDGSMMIMNILGGMYLFGLAAFLVFVAISVGRIRILLSACVPVRRPDLDACLEDLRERMGISRQVELLSLNIPGGRPPACIGVFRPRIVLSRSMVEEWTVEECAPLLLHELAHVRRRDLLVNWIQVFIQAVFFFHPFVWYANNRIRKHREEICDDITVRNMEGEHAPYVKSILKVMEERFAVPASGMAAVGLFEGKGSLAERIRRIMRTNYLSYRSLTIASIAVLVFVLIGTVILVGINSSHPVKTAAPLTEMYGEYKDNTIVLLPNGRYVVKGMVVNKKEDLEKVILGQSRRYHCWIFSICLAGADRNSEQVNYLKTVLQRVYDNNREEMIKAGNKQNMAYLWKYNKMDWFLRTTKIQQSWNHIKFWLAYNT